MSRHRCKVHYQSDDGPALTAIVTSIPVTSMTKQRSFWSATCATSWGGAVLRGDRWTRECHQRLSVRQFAWHHWGRAKFIVGTEPEVVE